MDFQNDEIILIFLSCEILLRVYIYVKKEMDRKEMKYLSTAIAIPINSHMFAIFGDHDYRLFRWFVVFHFPD